jgi:putative ABC transport system permease protein
MSFATALSLSLNNLMTKKTRTFMTAFAGSIGIIGIALIMAMASGIQTYIDKVQEDTLSSYPITIQRESMDLAGMFRTFAGETERESAHEPGKVYGANVMTEMMNTMVAEVQTNNLEAFKKYIENKENPLSADISTIQYHYPMVLNVYKADTSIDAIKVNPSTLFDTFYGDSFASDMASQMSSMFSTGVEVWEEMLDNQALLSSQYDVIAGAWPENYNEIVLIVDENNEISDMALYALGLRDMDEVQRIMEAAMMGETYETEASSYTYEDLLSMRFKLVIPADYYKEEEDGSWSDIREDRDEMKNILDHGISLKLVGIIKPNEDAISTSMRGSIGYTKALTDYVIKESNARKIVKQQLEHPDIDVFTSIAFSHGEEEELEVEMTMEEVDAYLATLDEETQAQMADYMSDMTQEQILEMFADQLEPETTDATYEGNLELLNVVDIDKPETMSIYAATFEAKNNISNQIEAYNNRVTEEGKEEYVINYTDIVGLMMSSISSIINVISYVLISFVAISLVVSSIMIGIITYISVLERTKEIGILRSVGASKRDISRVFNAETLIVGFVSGALGILITILLTFPANRIIHNLTGISGVKAHLPVESGIVLVIISMILTLIAGLIPSRLAAKKDPVVALRSE